MALSFSVFNKFKAIDGVTAPIRKMTKSVGKFGKEATAAFKRADRASSRFGKRLRGIGRDLSTKMTLPIAVLGGVTAKLAIGFESAWTGVRKTVDATKKQFVVLKKELMALALKIPVTTTKLFEIAEAAGQLDIKLPNIPAFTKTIAALGIAAPVLEMQESAIQLAQFAKVTRMNQKHFDRLASVLVYLGNNTATTENKILNMSMRLAAAGTTIGLTQAEIFGLGAALAQLGLEAEGGGTAFSRVMRQMNKEIALGSNKMDLFAAVSGQTVNDFKTAWEKDSLGAVIKFVEGLDKLKKKGISVEVVLDNLGMDAVRISDALTRASKAGEEFRETIKDGSKEWKRNTALMEELSKRLEDARAQLTMARSRVEQMAVTFGAVFVPAILKVVKFLEPVVDWLKALSPSTKMVIIVVAALAAAIGPLLIVLGLMASGITAIIAIGAPVIATISAITFAIMGIGSAIVMVIKNWDFLKQDFVLGIEFITNKLKTLTGGIVGRIAGFLGFGAPEQPEQQETSISPNAGLAGAIRQETEIRSRVSVDFSNLPKGAEVKQTGKTPGFDLELGFAGA